MNRVRPMASSSCGPSTQIASMLKPRCQIATWEKVDVTSCQ